MEFQHLGFVGFEEALRLQEDLVGRISKRELPETILILQHPHVFTSGRAGNDANRIADRDWDGRAIEVIRTSRGGDVTYHGPGQLVAYPLLDLRRRGGDIHLYLRDLEKCLMKTVGGFGVDAFPREGKTGLWTNYGKLASIGIGVRRWVTMHGIALNVSTDLRYFQLINPCGIPDCPMTSLTHLLGRLVTVDEVIPVFRRCFLEVFSTAEDQP